MIRLRIAIVIMISACAVPAGVGGGAAAPPPAGAAAARPDTARSIPAVTAGDSLLVRPAQTKADTSLLDSAARKVLADSLMRLQIAATGGYASFTRDIDSVFGLRDLYQHRLFATDAMETAELLRLSPYYVYVPLTIAGALNRSLFMGMPLSRIFAGDGADATIDYHDYTAIISPAELGGMTVDPGSGTSLALHPQALAAPVNLLYWENGVFRENALQVLFARPLTQSVRAAVYTNYRSFASQTFSHQYGAISSTYEGMVKDTSLIMYGGRNPLTSEMVAGARLSWDGVGPSAVFDYRYADLVDEIAVPGATTARDNATPGLTWSTVGHFLHCADLDLAAIEAGPLRGYVSGFFRSAVQRQRPGTGYLVSSTRGTALWGGGGLRLALPLSAHDTVSLLYQGRGENRTPYDGRLWRLRSNRATGAWNKVVPLGGWELGIDASAGQEFGWVGDSAGNAWVWSGAARLSRNGLCVTVFTRRDAEVFAPPLDTAVFVRGQVLDPLAVHGGDVRLNTKHFGVLAGYTYATAADSATIARYWPGGVAPCPQPHSVVTIAPQTGRFLGFGLYSRWMISDARPYLKVQSAISYEAAAANGNEHLNMDLIMDYWSTRDQAAYAGSTMWNREIWNLNLKIAIQIKEFRLFYKMDNLLNREMAYVPGYTLPGLTFRWGFNWLLQR